MKDDKDDEPRPPVEISARTGFSQNRLWRDGEHRNAESLDAALAHRSARFYLSTPDGNWLCRTGAGDRGRVDPAFTGTQARSLGARLDAAVLLGFAPDGAPVLAATLGDGALPAEDLSAIDLRSLGMQRLLDPDTEGRLGQAAHLLGWHRRNGFCARCGARTVAEAAGYRRRCTACDAVVFPRTDPVTIMLVHDGADRCILGRQPRFAENFWSCLAGFVEAGETVEDAVRRETLEEAGVHVGKVSYLASQPWAFPGNLMIGCIGVAQDFAIDFDTDELEACRWFSRDEVTAMLADTHPGGLRLPQPFAIAHHLVRAFADGTV